MSDIEQIQDELRRFNQERDWDQFHNGKDLAVGLSVEASELLESYDYVIIGKSAIVCGSSQSAM